MKDIVATFPHIANYYIPINLLLTKGLGLKCIIPPPLTKKTLDYGSKNSPDFVCAPFKYNLGNYIEALEKGANLLFQTNGGCRVGYYGELQETILKDLGYDFKFIQISLNEPKKVLEIYNEFKQLGIKVNFFKFIYYILLCIKMIKKIDIYEDYLRKNIGFERYNGEFKKAHKRFLNRLKKVKKFKELRLVVKEELTRLYSIEVDKPKDVLKVGVVGELYTLMDDFSNHYLEYELAKKGVEITRYVNLDYLIFRNSQNYKKLLKKKNGYVKYDLGAGATDSVVKSLYFAQNEFDGIIHVKASFCTPEVNAMSIMQNISGDYEIPILYFSFDTATTDAGVKTRLEAFYDMIEMRGGK